jgi:hypothetical protein
MPKVVAREQQATVSHRMNFWGRPSGPNTVSWRYKGVPWEVERPDDGQPAVRGSVRCGVCDKDLTFTVHSVAATRRRQARWRAIAWVGLLVFVAGAVALFTSFESDDGVRIVASVSAFFLGAVVGWTAASAAGEEVGVSGHGNGWPGLVPKHHIALVEPRPAALPELICAHCGHQEDYPWGSGFRTSWVERQYGAARARFEQHACRP